MEFDEAFKQRLAALFAMRRDVRQFRSTPLPEGMIERLLEIACLAPSVGLSQPWRFVIVDSPSCREQVRSSFLECNAAACLSYAEDRAAAYARLKLEGLDQAPCQVAVFAEPEPITGHGLGRRTMPETIHYSVVMAIHTLWLAARAEGIGLGWVSILDPAAIHAALGVPTDWAFIGYLCLGYPTAPNATPELEQQGWDRRQPASTFITRR